MALNCRHWVALGLRSWQSILILKDQHISLTSKSTFWFLSKSSWLGRGIIWHWEGSTHRYTPLLWAKIGIWKAIVEKVPQENIVLLWIRFPPYISINIVFCSIFAALQIEKYVVLSCPDFESWIRFWESLQALSFPASSLAHGLLRKVRLCAAVSFCFLPCELQFLSCRSEPQRLPTWHASALCLLFLTTWTRTWTKPP